MLKGNLGQPVGGFPETILRKVLKGESPNKDRPGSRLPLANLEASRKELKKAQPEMLFSEEDFFSYLMYPKVFSDYQNNIKKYGPVNCLPTSVFFYGMRPGEEISAEIDPGKILEIRLQALSETNDVGEKKVFFELNGQPRVVRVFDKHSKIEAVEKLKADMQNPKHVGSPMPGVVATINISENQKVNTGDLLMTMEAMKMETGIYSEKVGIIKSIHVEVGSQLDAKDLLVEFE